MAGELKEIAKFSADALKMVLNTMPEKQRKSFEDGLKFMTEKLGEKEEKKTQPKTQKPQDEIVFKTSVLPAIHQRLKEIEQQEMRGTLNINVKFDITTNFAAFNLEQLLEFHSNLLRAEEGFKMFTLFLQYSRGLLYLEMVHKLQKKGQGLKEFVEESLTVSHMTVLRYMTLASIISTYPRLVLCQLTFTQILKHKNRLLRFLMSDEGQDLNSKLSLSVEIIANSQKVKFECVDMKTTNVKFSTDPDWKYHDEMHSKEEMSDSDVQGMVASRVPVDEEGELLGALRLVDFEKHKK